MQFAGFRAFMYFINPGIKFFTAVYGILYCFFGIIRSRKQFKTGLYGEQLILYIMAEDLGGGFCCVNLLGDFKSLRIDLVADMGEPVQAAADEQQENNENKGKDIIKNKAVSQINIPKIVGLRNF